MEAPVAVLELFENIQLVFECFVISFSINTTYVDYLKN